MNHLSQITKAVFIALLVPLWGQLNAAIPAPDWRGTQDTSYIEWTTFTKMGSPTLANGNTFTPSHGTGNMTIAQVIPGGAPPAMVTTGQLYTGGGTLDLLFSGSVGFNLATIHLQLEYDPAGPSLFSAPLLTSSTGSFSADYTGQEGSVFFWTWTFENPEFDNFSIALSTLAAHTAINGVSLDLSNSLQAIPEPSTYALLGCFGLLGLVAVRRFRQKA